MFNNKLLSISRIRAAILLDDNDGRSSDLSLGGNVFPRLLHLSDQYAFSV